MDFVQATSAFFPTPGTRAALPFPSAVQGGDLLLVAVANSFFEIYRPPATELSRVSVSDSAGNAYLQAGDYAGTFTDGRGLSVSLWHTAAGGDGPLSVTVTPYDPGPDTQGVWYVGLLAYRGVVAADGAAGQYHTGTGVAGDAQASTPAVPVTAASAGAPELVVAVFSDGGSNSGGGFQAFDFVPDPPFTLRLHQFDDPPADQTGMGLAVVEGLVTGPAAVTGAFTLNGVPRTTGVSWAALGAGFSGDTVDGSGYAVAWGSGTAGLNASGNANASGSGTAGFNCSGWANAFGPRPPNGRRAGRSFRRGAGAGR